MGGMRLLLIFALCTLSFSTPNSNYAAAVLGPLCQITDWNQFAWDLAMLKANGIQTMSTDIWWGIVMAGSTRPSSYTWTYYDSIASALKTANMSWVPIISMHSCLCSSVCTGTYNLDMPVWAQNAQTSVKGGYTDECGNMYNGNLSPWYSSSGSTAYTELKWFLSNFTSHYSGYANTPTIIRIDLSGGPSGELRYPSYDMSDGYNWPSRGQVMAYSDQAITSFSNWASAKYGSKTAALTAWGFSTSINITTPCNLTPPCAPGSVVNACIGNTNWNSGTSSYSSTSDFFSAGLYLSSNGKYGPDFLEWYQNVLIWHAGNMSAAVNSSGILSTYNVPVGIKIANVYPFYFKDPNGNSNYPHIFEYTTGYVNYTKAGFGIIPRLQALGLQTTLTGSEYDDDNTSGGHYSGCQSLSVTFLSYCSSNGYTCRLENAGSITNPGADHAYFNMRNLMYSYNVAALTLLRYTDLTSSPAMMDEFAKNVLVMNTASTVLHFQVQGIGNTAPYSLTQYMVIPGNIFNGWATASAFKLQPVTSSCSNTTGSQCTWVGTAIFSAQGNYNLQFKVAWNNAGTLTWHCPAGNLVYTLYSSNNFFYSGFYINAGGSDSEDCSGSGGADCLASYYHPTCAS